MINAVKDAMTSRAALSFVNNQISRYGTVQDLKIDSRQKTVTVSCLLHGESAPITVKAENYVIETKGDKKFVHVTRFSCSRPWLGALLTDFGQNRKVELPPWAAAAL
ncbi:MAG: hypothetical protein JWM32_2661 [Verrucomicrobia bacterium]|nr:hypothetical protein [Verrucomicrobiota bacterium]